VISGVEVQMNIGEGNDEFLKFLPLYSCQERALVLVFGEFKKLPPAKLLLIINLLKYYSTLMITSKRQTK
jgi:hypothetical protein